jgi:hypothetical protein
MKKIEIICNRKVRDYVTSRLKSLTGLSVSQAYDLLKNEGCLPIAECADILKRCQLLLKMIDSFKFPASIPVRPVDDRHLWQFRERWSKHLQGLLDKMVARSKPVYLADEVNKQLKRRKSSIQCSRVHLIWYLDVYGEENMNPESIATAIIKFGVTDWSKVQPLVGNSKYSITITDENMEVDQDEFRHLVEFIWDIPTSNTQNNLIEMIQNDVKVLEDFRKLWESAPRTYDYKRVFEEYVSRLQTLPPSKKRVSLKKEVDSESRSGVEEDRTVTRYNEVVSYLNELTGGDYFAKKRIEERDEAVRSFCKLSNFDECFNDVKAAVTHSEVRFPTATAIGLIEQHVNNQGIILK